MLGLINLASACLETDFESLVNAGSSSEYGFSDHAPAEDELPEPNSEYAVTKASATLLCGFLARRHGRRLSTLRLYSVYGPWEGPRRLVPTLVARGLQGELPSLVSPETGRDFVYLDDACDAFLAAAAAAAPETAGAVYNVGTGRQTTIREAVEVARRVLDIDAEPDWGTHEGRAWDTSVWVADPSRIQRWDGGLASTSRRAFAARSSGCGPPPSLRAATAPRPDRRGWGGAGAGSRPG